MNCAASLRPGPTTLVGATTRNGRRAVRPGVRDQRQGLDGLAEPHVVGQDPAEPALPEEREPAEPVELVGPQLRLDADRVDVRAASRGPQRLRRPGTHWAACASTMPDLGELVPQARGRGGRPGRRRRAAPAARAAASTSRQVRELGPVDAQVLAVAQDDPVGAVGQRLEHVGQRDVRAVDGDARPRGRASRWARRAGRGRRSPRLRSGSPGRRRARGSRAGRRSPRSRPARAAQRQQLLGEQDRVRVVEVLLSSQAHARAGDRGRGGAPARRRAARRVEQRRSSSGRRTPRSPRVSRQGVDAVVRADPVAPRPGDAHLVDGHPGDRQREPRLGRRGHVDATRRTRRPGRAAAAGGGTPRRGRRGPAAGTTTESPRLSSRRTSGPGGTVSAASVTDHASPSASHSATACPPSPSTSRSAAPYHSPSSDTPSRSWASWPGRRVDVELERHRVGQPDVGQARPGEQRDARLDGPADQRDLVRTERAQGDAAVGPEVDLPHGRPVPGEQVVEREHLGLRVHAVAVEVGHVRPVDPGAHPVVSRAATHGAHPQGTACARQLLGPAPEAGRRAGGLRSPGARAGFGRSCAFAARSSSSSSSEDSWRSQRRAGPGDVRAWSSRTVISTATACLHPSLTGQLHRPKTQTPSPSTPTDSVTTYGALVDPDTVPRTSRSPSESRSWLDDSTWPRRT